MLRHFMLDYFKQHPIKRDDIPVVEGKPIDLTRFFAEVYTLGGYEKVSFIIISMFVAFMLIPLSNSSPKATTGLLLAAK